MESKQRTPLEIMHGVIALEPENFPPEKLAEFIAEDCVVHEAESLPVGGDWKGVQGFIDLMVAVRTTFPNFLFELESIVTDDNQAAIKAKISGDTPGGRFKIPLVEYWTFRDSKAIDVLPVWHDTKLVADLYNATVAAE